MTDDKRVTMTVTLPNLTPAQAIALDAMFHRWRECARIGASRYIAFMVDGDGNFRPKRLAVSFSNDPYPMADEIERAALRADARRDSRDGVECFDFDPIAWRLRP